MRSFCSAKASFIFSTKNINVFGYKVVKHLLIWPLNELVKLTMLWTTGPWSRFFERETPPFYNQRIQDVKTETESLVAVLLDQSGITWQVMAHFIPSSVSACTFWKIPIFCKASKIRTNFFFIQTCKRTVFIDKLWPIQYQAVYILKDSDILHTDKLETKVYWILILCC